MKRLQLIGKLPPTVLIPLKIQVQLVQNSFPGLQVLNTVIGKMSGVIQK